jgi:hypothetical protein
VNALKLVALVLIAAIISLVYGGIVHQDHPRRQGRPFEFSIRTRRPSTSGLGRGAIVAGRVLLFARRKVGPRDLHRP